MKGMYDLVVYYIIQERNDGRSFATSTNFVRRKEQTKLCCEIARNHLLKPEILRFTQHDNKKEGETNEKNNDIRRKQSSVQSILCITAFKNKKRTIYKCRIWFFEHAL